MGKVRKVVVDHPGVHAKASGHMFCQCLALLFSLLSSSFVLLVAVDGLTGAIYCHQCEDFVYAEIIDTWRNRALRTMEERSDISVDGEPSRSPSIKLHCGIEIRDLEHGKRVKFKVWKPTPEEKAVLDKATPVRCHCTSPSLFSRTPTHPRPT